MKVLVRLLGLIRPHWRWVILGIGLSLATLLANLGLLALSSWFIATMAIAGALRVTIDYTLPATGVRALALGRAAGRYAERLVNHNTTFKILATLRVWLYERVEPLAPAVLARYRSGDLLSRIRADIDTLDDFYVRGFVPTVVAILALAVILPFLARFSRVLVWIDLAALAFAGALLPLLLRMLGERPGRERIAAAAALRSSVVEAADGMGELIAFGAAGWHAERLERESRALDQRILRVARLQGVGEAGMIAASSLAVWGAALLLVPLVEGGALPKPDIAMLTVFMLASFETIMPLPLVIQRIGEISAAARRLFEVIDAAPAVREPTGAIRAAAFAAAAGGALPPSAEGRAGDAWPPERIDLRFQGVRFRYGPDRPWVLDRFSLELPAGSRLALVGPTGVGKSSVINLLLRFWEYEGGSILAGGQELKELSGADARRLFAVVPQNPFLFHGTIRENLSLGLDYPEEAMREALLDAELGALLAELPDGLDATVGERGLALSVGQGGRLAVARALLKRAPVFLFDEPTEGLDDATAERLLDAIDRRVGARSLLLVTHRARDLRIAHRVVEVPHAGVQ